MFSVLHTSYLFCVLSAAVVSNNGPIFLFLKEFYKYGVSNKRCYIGICAVGLFALLR